MEKCPLFLLFIICVQSAPHLLWTDVTSAPIGGHVVLGGYDLGTTGQVMFGAIQATQIISWGPRQRGAETHQIEVVVPAGSAASGTVHVVVGGVATEALPFKTHAGNFYYASPTGTNNSPDDCTMPTHSCSLRRARTRMSAGDVLYLRGGTYNQPDSYDPVNAPVKPVLYETSGGTAAQPKTFRNYPGEDVLLDGSAIRPGGYNAVYMEQGHVQLVGMRLTSGESTVIQPVVSFERFANLEIFGCRGVTVPCSIVGSHAAGIGYIQGSTNIDVVGCEVHSHGSDRQDHGLYVKNSDSIIAYNRLHNNPGYGVHGRGPSGSWFRLKVYGNLVYNNGIAGEPSGGGIILTDGCNDALVENNILWDNLVCLTTAQNAANNVYRHNTCFRSSKSEADFSSSGATTAYNNAFYHRFTASTARIVLYSNNPITSDYNAWHVDWNGNPEKWLFKWFEGATDRYETFAAYQAGNAPYDRNSVFTAPMFVDPAGDPPDAHLLAGSPLAGSALAGQCPAVDFFAELRSGPCDIGGLRAGGSSPTGGPPPTSAPSAVPTPAPTLAPTTVAPPTNAPSAAPTGAPTPVPTSSPTTADPTGAPTSAPTNTPTRVGQTLQPTTLRPTAAPSQAPTLAPTRQPSLAPTGAPTVVGQPAPTAAPPTMGQPATAAPTAATEDFPTGAVVGGAIGGLVLLSAGVLGGILLFRHCSFGHQMSNANRAFGL